MKHYNTIVIGTGAGTKIARESASKGFKTAVIEKDELGGTCLNKGCIPSKMLIHPADVAQTIDYAKKFNIVVDNNYIVQFSKLTKRINKTVREDSLSIKEKYESGSIKNLDFYYGSASFIEDKVIEINGTKITGDTIVIGTGARPSIPPIPGLLETPYWTSKEALRATKLPEKLVVIGGGYIGVELGNAYGSLGSQVHFITRGGFVGALDEDVREELTQTFSKKYKIDEGDTKSVEYDTHSKIFTLKVDVDGKTKTIKADALLVATGVKPNNDTLNLENTSIKLTKRGFLKVNKHLETTLKGVYGFGDCVGNYMFRHSANFEAEYLNEKLVNKTTTKPISYPPMPWAIFSNPQIAGIGENEKTLQQKGIEYIIGINPYEKSAMGQALLSEEGFVKLLFEKKTKKLLGAMIIGEQASTMIHMCIVLLTKKAKLDDFFSFIYIHPALPENVRNAARDANQKFNQQ